MHYWNFSEKLMPKIHYNALINHTNFDIKTSGNYLEIEHKPGSEIFFPIAIAPVL